jgi:hypothetical protein
MAFKKGQGGRKKGGKNIRTMQLEEIAAQYKLSPFEVLMKIANREWESLGYPSEDKITPQLQAHCAAEAAQYLHPKRKAVEHTGKEGQPIKAEVVWVTEFGGSRESDDDEK